MGLEAVADYWNREACGEQYGDRQRQLRYELEPEILPFANFAAARDKRLLEIGVGMGADFLRFVEAGAIATGVDLTERAVGITTARLREGQLQAEVLVANAESLPFADESFDIVYSWGVLHHTPDTARALREATRVLAPGGVLKVMLYHRYSWVAFRFWARRSIVRRQIGSLRTAVVETESPGTKAFTRREVAGMLPALQNLSIRPVISVWDRRAAPRIASLLGNRLGWFLLIEGRR